jgi:hypothetical protein
MFTIHDCWPAPIITTPTITLAYQYISVQIQAKGGYIHQHALPHTLAPFQQRILTTCGVYTIKESTPND